MSRTENIDNPAITAIVGALGTIPIKRLASTIHTQYRTVLPGGGMDWLRTDEEWEVSIATFATTPAVFDDLRAAGFIVKNSHVMHVIESDGDAFEFTLIRETRP